MNNPRFFQAGNVCKEKDNEAWATSAFTLCHEYLNTGLDVTEKCLQE